MKRVVLLLVVLGMLAITASPALANNGSNHTVGVPIVCKNPDNGDEVFLYSAKGKQALVKHGYDCNRGK